mmetsp:Transcript_31350/g.86183  ORF Transcript_31350/g.86183 Transcript_31350/m.86183 type:complete len:213 (-) Transcript_31350:1105-1743(-)
MVRRDAVEELALVLVDELVRLVRGAHVRLPLLELAVLALLHREDDADLRLRDTRRRDAVDGNLQHIDVLLIVRKDDEVRHLLPLHPQFRLNLLLALRLVQVVEVRILVVPDLLHTHVSEKGYECTHLPGLVEAKKRQEGESCEGHPQQPEENRQADEEQADEDGEKSPSRREVHVHGEGLQGLGGRILRLPDLIFVDDGHNASVQLHRVIRG